MITPGFSYQTAASESRRSRGQEEQWNGMTTPFGQLQLLQGGNPARSGGHSLTAKCP